MNNFEEGRRGSREIQRRTSDRPASKFGGLPQPQIPIDSSTIAPLAPGDQRAPAQGERRRGRNDSFGVGGVVAPLQDAGVVAQQPARPDLPRRISPAETKAKVEPVKVSDNTTDASGKGVDRREQRKTPEVVKRQEPAARGSRGDEPRTREVVARDAGSGSSDEPRERRSGSQSGQKEEGDVEPRRARGTEKPPPPTEPPGPPATPSPEGEDPDSLGKEPTKILPTHAGGEEPPAMDVGRNGESERRERLGDPTEVDQSNGVRVSHEETSEEADADTSAQQSLTSPPSEEAPETQPHEARPKVPEDSALETISVVAPVLMEPGQNLYDQFPFQQVLAQVAERTGIEQRDVGHLLSSYLKRLQSPRTTGDTELARYQREGLEKMDPRVVRELLPEYKRREKGENYRAENLRIALRRVVTLLDGARIFPYWREYLQAKIDPANYIYDGSYVEKARVLVPEPTYLTWAADRVTRDQSIQAMQRIIAVGEAFPQQMVGTTPTEQREVIMRTWVLRRTRGLTESPVTKLPKPPDSPEN